MFQESQHAVADDGDKEVQQELTVRVDFFALLVQLEERCPVFHHQGSTAGKGKPDHRRVKQIQAVKDLEDR